MTSGTLSYTFFNCEDQEIVMLTRGRRCTGNDTIVDSECTTVFVDDYRYEREMLETNVVDWYFFIAMMRAGAQGYFWVRLAILILFKIPFEVVVYSSLLPVSGYVIALLLDSSFMDLFLDSFWAAVGGSINIGLFSFLKSTAVQMRNVWLLSV
ncbi:hypothetical protein PHYSODRAFT_518049, partial [Phytophthora sojae]